MGKNVTWYKSVRFKLIIPIALAFIILSIMSTTLLTIESIQTSEQILANLRQEIVLRVSNTIEDKLEQAIKLNELHALALNNQVLKLNEANSREIYFSATLTPYEDVAMTYIGLPNGSFYGARRLQDNTIQIVRNDETTEGNSNYYDIDSNGRHTTLAQVFENFDARTRPWYQNALEKKEISFSPLYSHFVFKVPTITASLPYYESNELIGVFGVDFLMTWLDETLSEISVGDHGTVFIVDKNNQLIASSTKEDIFQIVDGKAININAIDSNNPIISEAMEVSYSSHQLSSFDIDDKSYLVGMDALKLYGLNWSVYTIIDKSDYTTNLNKSITRMNTIVFIVSLLFLVFIAYSNHKFAAPILALNKHARLLSDGAFVPVNQFSHSPEMTQLIDSFNKMGDKIQSYVGDLQQEVMKQTEMYENAAVEAQSANIAKSTFLSTMSHELRTPLNGILGMVELLKTTDLNEEQQDYLNLAEYTSQTLIQLINEVLDYSKIEAQQVELEKLPFNLKSLKEDVESLSRLYVTGKGLGFNFNVDASTPEQMIGDRFRIRQILTNLIGNAVKFTKNGKISVSIELMQMYEDTHEALLRCSVKDTGVGIPLDRQSILFEPFSQVDTSTTREYGGTGLGLAISKNLVELMNGTISFNSEPGVGSEFTFTFRVGYLDINDTSVDSEIKLKVDTDIQKNWMAHILSKPLRILLAEDSKENYEYISGIAQKSNWKLLHAKNGEQAVDVFLSNRGTIDVVLMDLEMPVLDGYETARQIREFERNAMVTSTHIVAISANVLAGEREKCIEIGMNDYLTKPFRIEQLLRVLDTVKSNN